MSKELEALNILRDNHIQFTKEKYGKLDKEKLENIINLKLARWNIVEKALKLLDIILTKSVTDRAGCNAYKYMESIGRYNSGLESQYRLTQEDFDLIKEFYDRYNRSDENGSR